MIKSDVIKIKKIENILTMEKFVPEVIVSHWVNPQLDLIIKLGERYNAKASLVFHGDSKLFSSVIRWAIVDVQENDLVISVSYEM